MSGVLKDAFTKDPHLSNLLLDPYFRESISGAQQSLRQVVAQAALVGVPSPALGAALSFYDGYRSATLPANLLQVSLFITYESSNHTHRLTTHFH